MSLTTTADWTRKAAEIAIPNTAWIDGKPVNALSGETAPTINPATGKVLAHIPDCKPADADLAVSNARDAFNGGKWSRMAPADRKAVLLRWADLLEQNLATLAILESLDSGKPIRDTSGIDVPGAIHTVRWTAEAIDKVYGEIAPTGQGTLALVQRLPLGVVLAIVPWNFPISTTAWKLAPAIAAGNSVILKPDPKTPLTALKMAELATEAGLPDGVLNVLPGDGINLGKHLCLHPDIDGQTFTGSTAVGKLLMQYSGQSNLKRTFLELGGKSANIIFADADLDAAANMAATAGFYNSGQTCTAGTRLLIQDSVYDDVIERVINRGQRWTPGNPLDPKTRMGAVIDKNQINTIQKYVQLGQEAGAHLALGGHIHQGQDDNQQGHFHQATLFTNVTNQMAIAQEEIFGPVVSAIRFSDAEDAIRIANDSPYGLAGAVWSQNLSNALTVANGVRTGTMGVNNYFGGDMTVPFGGFKESGNGRDKSLHALDDYTELKTTWIEY